MFKPGDVVVVLRKIKERGKPDIVRGGMREVIKDHGNGEVSIGLIGAAALKTNIINVVKAKDIKKASQPSAGYPSSFNPYVAHVIHA